MYVLPKKPLYFNTVKKSLRFIWVLFPPKMLSSSSQDFFLITGLSWSVQSWSPEITWPPDFIVFNTPVPPVESLTPCILWSLTQGSKARAEPTGAVTSVPDSRLMEGGNGQTERHRGRTSFSFSPFPLADSEKLMKKQYDHLLLLLYLGSCQAWGGTVWWQNTPAYAAGWYLIVALGIIIVLLIYPFLFSLYLILGIRFSCCQVRDFTGIKVSISLILHQMWHFCHKVLRCK